MRKIVRKYNIGLSKLKVNKPELKPGESQSDWMARCIPVLITEGKTQEQASGQCAGMFQNKSVEKFEEVSSKFETKEFEALEDFNIDGFEIKKGQELHYMLGVVLEPETIDATTTEKSFGDIYSEEEVRKAAHYFMAEYNGHGHDVMHSGKNSPDLKVVESYLAPVDMKVNKEDVKKGTWMMASLVLNDRIWNAIKEGEITGYSIGGIARGKLEEVV